MFKTKLSKLYSKIIIWIFLFSICPVVSQQNSRIEYRSPNIAILQEVGMVQSGLYEQYFTDDWIDHFGAFWTQQAVIDERLLFTIGLGGSFQFPKQEKVGSGWNGNGNSLTKFFFVGPTQADFNYLFGEVEEPWLTVGMGIFSYKYNRDAVNLGEYLFRANPYPNYLFTGGYSIVNSASAYVQGAKAEWKKNGLSISSLLLTETTIAPLYDGSLAFLVNYETPGKLLDAGFGVNFKRLISVDPDKTSPEENRNAYVNLNGMDYTLNKSFYTDHARFFRNSARDNQAAADSLSALGLTAEAAGFYVLAGQDSLQQAALDAQADVVQSHLDTLNFLQDILDTSTNAAQISSASADLNGLPGREYYTASGTVLMAKLALDFKALVPSDLWGENDLRLYAEAALLGVKDYPIYYEDKMQRIPVMFGVNLPTFKLLDLLALQAEYFNSPYINSTYNVLSYSMPLPFYPSGGDDKFSENSYYDITQNDNWTWSVLMRKNIYGAIGVSAQVARDHLRTVSANVWAGPKLEAHEIMIRKKDWYWAVQVSMGM